MTIEEIKAMGLEREEEINEINELIKEGELGVENFNVTFEHSRKGTPGVVKDYGSAEVVDIIKELERSARRLEAQLKVMESLIELFKVLPPDVVVEAWRNANGKEGQQND